MDVLCEHCRVNLIDWESASWWVGGYRYCRSCQHEVWVDLFGKEVSDTVSVDTPTSSLEIQEVSPPSEKVQDVSSLPDEKQGG